jgi:hypothetical protein
MGSKMGLETGEKMEGRNDKKVNITEPMLFVSGSLAEVLGGKAGETIWIKLKDAEKLLESLKVVNGTGRAN